MHSGALRLRRLMNPLSDRRPTLPPPQFHLRTLLLAVALCCMALATIQWVSPAVFLGILFLGLCIAAHVAGNSLGTRLRENGDRPIPPLAPLSERFSPVPRGELPEATQLSSRNGLGWAQLIAMVSGIVLGAIGGGLGAALLSRRLDESIIALGIVAFGTLGGIFAFVGYSFTQVFWSAYMQAQGPTRPADASSPSASDQPGSPLT